MMNSDSYIYSVEHHRIFVLFNYLMQPSPPYAIVFLCSIASERLDDITVSTDFLPPTAFLIFRQSNTVLFVQSTASTNIFFCPLRWQITRCFFLATIPAQTMTTTALLINILWTLGDKLRSSRRSINIAGRCFIESFSSSTLSLVRGPATDFPHPSAISSAIHKC